MESVTEEIECVPISNVSDVAVPSGSSLSPLLMMRKKNPHISLPFNCGGPDLHFMMFHESVGYKEEESKPAKLIKW